MISVFNKAELISHLIIRHTYFISYPVFVRLFQETGSLTTLRAGNPRLSSAPITIS